MVDIGGTRVSWLLVNGTHGGIHDGDDRVRPRNVALPHDAAPDLQDAATLGCLWAQAEARTYPPGTRRHLAAARSALLAYGLLDSRTVQALVAALEATR